MLVSGANGSESSPVQKFRGLIVREIDDIKSNLNHHSLFFKEGIAFLYEVLDTADDQGTAGTAGINSLYGEGKTFCYARALNDSGRKTRTI